VGRGWPDDGEGGLKRDGWAGVESAPVVMTMPCGLLVEVGGVSVGVAVDDVGDETRFDLKTSFMAGMEEVGAADGGACESCLSEGEGIERMRSEAERWRGAGSVVMVTGTCTVLVVAGSEEGERWGGVGLVGAVEVLLCSGVGTVGDSGLVCAVGVLFCWGAGTVGGSGLVCAVEVLGCWGGGIAGSAVLEGSWLVLSSCSGLEEPGVV
jgi:hypothetical protein